MPNWKLSNLRLWCGISWRFGQMHHLLFELPVQTPICSNEQIGAWKSGDGGANVPIRDSNQLWFVSGQSGRCCTEAHPTMLLGGNSGFESTPSLHSSSCVTDGALVGLARPGSSLPTGFNTQTLHVCRCLRGMLGQVTTIIRGLDPARSSLQLVVLQQTQQMTRQQTD